MSLTTPFPADLLPVARKVVRYEKPEEPLADLRPYQNRIKTSKSELVGVVG
jgi:hypothetical protein